MGQKYYREKQDRTFLAATQLAIHVRQNGQVPFIKAARFLKVSLPTFIRAYKEYFIDSEDFTDISVDGKCLRYCPVAPTEDEVIEAGKAFIALSKGGGNGKKRAEKAEAGST